MNHVKPLTIWSEMVIYRTHDTKMRNVQTRLKPRTFLCDTPNCTNNGYGPMLRSVVWNKHFKGCMFLCESCMQRRLGKPITGYMLRDCPLNGDHPRYQPHGMM